MNPNFKKNYAYSQSIYHLQENSGPIGMSLRGHPIFFNSLAVQDSDKHGKKQWIIWDGLHLSGCEVSFLVRSNAMWNIIVLDKIFYNSVGLVLAEVLYAGRQIENQNMLYFSKDKTLPFPQCKWCSVVNLPLSCWLVTQGNSVTLDLVFVSAAGRSGTQS